MNSTKYIFQQDAFGPLVPTSQQMSVPEEGGPQVSKLEQVSKLGHHLPLAAGPGLGVRVQEGGGVRVLPV